MELKATIIDWNYEKGYGFLDFNSQRIFIHIRDFSTRKNEPRVGDRIQFRMGHDSKGRTCAVNATKIESRPFPFISLIFFALVLVLPCLAIHRVPLNPKISLGYLAGINLIAWLFYGHDKRRAQSGGWRVPESSLHLLELAGGWPSAFLAQLYYRHKTSKTSYRITFWLIIALHQYICFDYLQN